MGKKKVARQQDEIKLSINGMLKISPRGPDGEFDIEGLMNSLRMELHNCCLSARKSAMKLSNFLVSSR